MRIKMLTTAAGPDGVWPAGSIQDLAAPQAKALISGGFAEPIDPPIEQAQAPKPVARETAEAPTQRKRRSTRSKAK